MILKKLDFYFLVFIMKARLWIILEDVKILKLEYSP